MEEAKAFADKSLRGGEEIFWIKEYPNELFGEEAKPDQNDEKPDRTLKTLETKNPPNSTATEEEQ